MSVKIMSEVWEYSSAGGADLLILLALADHAGDDRECYPSMATLARKARIAERSAQRCVHRLIEMGELEIVEAGGGRTSNRYRITTRGDSHVTPVNLTPPLFDPVTPDPPVVAATTHRSYEPSLNRQEVLPPVLGEEHSKYTPPAGASVPPVSKIKSKGAATGPKGYPRAFEAFWATYPRKVGKLAAFRQWELALKRGFTEEAVRLAAARYRLQVTQEATETRFVAHAATWLHGGRYEDYGDLAPAPADGRPLATKLAELRDRNHLLRHQPDALVRLLLPKNDPDYPAQEDQRALVQRRQAPVPLGAVVSV